MADEMNTDERAKFIHWHMDYLHTDEMLAAHIWDNQHSAAKAWQARAAMSPDACDMATASAQGFRDGVASLSAAEPAAHFDAQGFREWVLRNLPDDTIIGSGLWWADHLTKYARLFVKTEAPAEPSIPALQPVELNPRSIRKFLQALQAGEMSVSRAVEILDAWVGGYYEDDMVPPPPSDSCLIADDEFPMEIVRKLRKELEVQAPAPTQGAAIAAVPFAYFCEMLDEQGNVVRSELSRLGPNKGDHGIPGWSWRNKPLVLASHGQAPAQPVGAEDVRAVCDQVKSELAVLHDKFPETRTSPQAAQDGLVDGAAICEAEARKWEKEAKKHQRKPGSLPSKHEARDLERAALCRSIAGKIRTPSPQAAQQAPAETMTLQEIWAAAGGNPGITPTRDDVLLALKTLDEVCDEATAQQALAGAALTDELRSLIEGMSVSVDVSTGDHDAGHRYFGTVTEIMECQGDKHGVTLLVQDAEPNFTAAPAAPSTPASGGWMPTLGQLLSAARNWGEVEPYLCRSGSGEQKYRIVFSVHERAAHFAKELLASPTIEGESNG